MHALELKRTFLKNPLNSIGVLIGIALFIEGFAWVVSYNLKLARVEKLGGPLPYIDLWLRGFIFPEIVTLLILFKLIDWYHSWFKINTIRISWRDILRYQLRLLPLFCLAFFAFNPFTQTARFFTESFPRYSFRTYWSDYLVGTFDMMIYVMYLIPTLVIGYMAANVSMLIDYFSYRRRIDEANLRLQQQQAAEIEAQKAAIKAAQVRSDQPDETTIEPERTYLDVVKGRNHQGDMLFRVDECCYFVVQDRYYYLYHAKGKYLITKTLNDLEAELDPQQFFRANRGILINRRAVQSYAYWEKGKYIIRLDASCQGQDEITLPRARLQDFRDWLAGRPHLKPPSDRDAPEADSASSPQQNPVFTDNF